MVFVEKCGSPQQLEGGSFIHEYPVATYACNVGLTMVGDGVITCVENNGVWEWEDIDFSCEGIIH